MQVITRFAPSPTGLLHIGGARTALFNYLFARHHHGRFFIRIEDTDKERSSNKAVEAIFDGLKWLGLEGDQPAIFQSNNINRHKKIANELINSNLAYQCFLSNSEIEVIRNQNKKEGKPFRSPWRNPGHKGNKYEKPVLRLRMPEHGYTLIKDIVQGDVKVDNRQLDDLVLLRSDDTPTYMLAVVVDDHDMNITHIIRGDDHLNNAIRQVKIYEALNWTPPIFGHIPLIHGSDGTKLSKRHGAIGVDTYKNMGIYPEAMNNYLSRLGWSHGNDEYFSMTQAISWFDGSSIGRSSSRFDMQKLFAVNGYWLRKQKFESLYKQILDHHSQQENKQVSIHFKKRFKVLLPHLLERFSIISELSSKINYLIYDGCPEIEDEVANLITKESCIILESFSKIIEKSPNNAESFEIFINNWLSEQELKMKDLGIPLRIALTGSKSAPSIFALIQSLGFEEVKLRINQICI